MLHFKIYLKPLMLKGLPVQERGCQRNLQKGVSKGKGGVTTTRHGKEQAAHTAKQKTHRLLMQL